MALDTLTRDDFAAHAGTEFRVTEFDDLVLVLTVVSPLQTSGDWDAFSLEFRGPADRMLEQRIYALDHEGLGAGELFLVPLGPRDGVMVYEAVFTRAAAAPTGEGA